MSRVLKFTFATLILVLFAQILIYAPQTLEETKETSPPPDSIDDDEDQEEDVDERFRGEHLVKNFHLVGTRDEKRDWELISQRAEGAEKRERWDLKVVKVIFYSTPSVTFTVTGDEGSIQLKTEDMEIEGNVKVVSSNGYIFLTDKVTYNSQDRILISPGAVRISGPPDEDGHRLKLRGGSMVANINSSEVEISDSVNATKAMSGDRKLRVRSQRALISGQTYKADFFKNVILNFNEITARGPRASFQIETETKKIVSASMGGGVKLSEVDKSAQSEDLLINFPQNRIELTGHPKLLQGEDEIVGDVIVFLHGGKKVRVEDARARVRSSDELRR